MAKRVLTGMRTTGALHLGHYAGALKRWKEIQDTGEYECFFLLADIQALTTHADQPESLIQSIKDVTLDWLSVGLDPNLSNIHFVLQSQVPGRSELSVLLTMIAGYSEVLRNPTLKDELQSLKNPTLGFINYPVDQAADIYMVSPTPPARGDHLLIPVGEDQVAHLELARRLARRFNKKFGRVFVPCEPMVGEVGRLPGISGKEKMSKSKNNTINLTDSPAEVERKVMRMFTDPNHIRADMPGDTVDNPVFIYHRAFNPNLDEVDDLTERYQNGKVGDVECKRKLIVALNNFLEPIRIRRAQFENIDITEILMQGSRAAQLACQPVVSAVKEKMFLAYPK